MRNGTVVHVIAPSPAGGAESVVLALAAATRATTRVVILNQVAGKHDPAHPLRTALEKRGVPTSELRCGRRRYAAEARELAGYLASVSATLVHTHGYHGTIVGYRAARRSGVRTVATVHGYLTRSLRERLYNALDRRVLRKFDAVIAVSPAIRDQLIGSGLRADRVHYVQNGLATRTDVEDRASLRTELGIDVGATVVAWIGRLSAEKGPDLFLRAIAAVPEATAVVIGDGPEGSALDALARSLRIQERVVFAGFRPDAARFLPAVDLLALTSRMEGTPMVILEAVAAGVPVVSFAVGGIPALLPEAGAWLVAPQDLQGLARALTEAIARPADRQGRAAHAREALADRLSLENWVRRVAVVYDLALHTS